MCSLIIEKGKDIHLTEEESDPVENNLVVESQIKHQSLVLIGTLKTSRRTVQCFCAKLYYVRGMEGQKGI